MKFKNFEEQSRSSLFFTVVFFFLSQVSFSPLLQPLLLQHNFHITWPGAASLRARWSGVLRVMCMCTYSSLIHLYQISLRETLLIGRTIGGFKK